MKAVLIQCSGGAANELRIPPLENLGLGYLASTLRADEFDVKIIDANLLGLMPHEIIARVGLEAPTIAGFSVFFSNYAVTKEVVASLHALDPLLHITLGGFYPTINWREILIDLPSVDSIVVGEGEQSLLGLCRALRSKDDWHQKSGLAYKSENGLVWTGPSRTTEELDSLSFPARDTLPAVFSRGNNVAMMATSRGCFYNCSFCSVKAFHRSNNTPGWRGRSPANVCDELESILVDYPDFRPFYVWFCDDEFIGPKINGKKHGELVAEEVIARNLLIQFEFDTRSDQVNRESFVLFKAAGLARVFIGIESFVTRILRLYQKGTTSETNHAALEVLKELGIDYQMGFIAFDPRMHFDEFKTNHAVLKSIGYHHVNIPLSRLRAYRATRARTQILGEDIADIRHRFGFDPIDSEGLDYKFQDSQVALLWSTLAGCDGANEKRVTALLAAFRNGLISSKSFWPLIFLVRDSISLYVDYAVAAVERGNCKATDVRKEIFRDLYKSRIAIERLTRAKRRLSMPIRLQMMGTELEVDTEEQDATIRSESEEDVVSLVETWSRDLHNYRYVNIERDESKV